jgi:single-stranded-DNA-specific exonuclease
VYAPYRSLAGVGVAFRLAQAVLQDAADRGCNGLTAARVDEICDELLDLVALGTVADMMPLVDENRSLVQQGLQRMKSNPRPGIAALMDAAGVTRETLDAQAISFRLAPRINAAGRLSNAMIAYRLLRTNDPAEARTLAQQLEALNRSRQNLTTEAEAEAETQVAQQQQAAQGQGAPANAPWLYMVQSSKIRAGIVGLVAGKLAEKYYRPSVVLETGAEESRGSARSIREFDIGAALDLVGDLLVRHGGHSRAAGFTVRNGQIAALQQALGEIAAAELGRHERLQPTLEVDAIAPMTEINWGLLDQFSRLEPTGQENPQPLLLSERARVRSYRSVGSGKHLKLVLDAGGWGDAVQDAIGFNMGAHAGALHEGDLVDIVYAVERNDFASRKSLQLNIKDLRTASSISGT